MIFTVVKCKSKYAATFFFVSIVLIIQGGNVLHFLYSLINIPFKQYLISQNISLLSKNITPLIFMKMQQ